MEGNLGTEIAAGRLGDRARHRAAVLVRARMHRGARADAGRLPRDEPRRRARLPRGGHEREHDGGARDSSRRCAPDSTGRASIAMPCHEYCSVGHEGHVGAREGGRSPGIRAHLRPAARGRPVYGSNRLVLAHFWAAFVAFAVVMPLGAWQMLVRSPLHRWVDPEHYYRAVTAHGTTLAYVFPTLVAMGFGYAVCAVSLGRPHARRAPRVDRVLAGARRRGHGARHGRRGQCDGAVHVLSAADGQPVLLHRCADRRRRLVDLGGAHGRRTSRAGSATTRACPFRSRCSPRRPARCFGHGRRSASARRSSS